jgi:hypothetical protein
VPEAGAPKGRTMAVIGCDLPKLPAFISAEIFYVVS